MFFDNGCPAYISLPDLHLVCKPCKEPNRCMLSACVLCILFYAELLSRHSGRLVKKMSDDIDDKVWRAEVEEYLQAYPNPIFVVMRVGQDSKVERDGQLELCTVTQVDGSLIQICYKVRRCCSPTRTLAYSVKSTEALSL